MDLIGDDPGFHVPFELLLDDPPVIVINKPAGLLTLGAKPEIPTLERLVKETLKQRFQKAGNVYLGIPHRLDRPVSGAIVFARNSKSAARMAEQFHERQVRKIYWAVLEKSPPEPCGVLEHYLRKVPDQPRVEVVPSEGEGAKPARLRYEVIGETALGPLVEVELETGRMHQIRVQFSAIGCPVAGDWQYGASGRFGNSCGTPAGDETSNPESVATESSGAEMNFDQRSAPIALHARRLSFRHPVRYDEVDVVARLPDYWPVISFSDRIQRERQN